jgi:Domain of unknown function (DUF5668)
MSSEWDSRACAGRGFTGGLVLLLMGGIFLLANLGVFQSHLLHVWWPLLLIVVGVAKVIAYGYTQLDRPRKRYSDFA